MLALFLTALGAVGLVAALYWRWAKVTRAEIDESGGLEWARLQSQGSALTGGLDEGRFRAVYSRVHFPRFPKYALAAAAAFVIALPATFYLLGALAWMFGSLGLSADAARLARLVPVEGAENVLKRDDGETIAMYWVGDILLIGYYFGLLFVWLAIVYVAMRRYHARRPGYLEEELASERSKGELTP
ncbi:MAG: hypothetical protein ACKVS5_09935 [Parvularculaceae bacterium]